MSQNKVFLIGNVTRDIDLKHTPKGKAVAEMGIAVNRVTYTEDRQRRDETTFIDVTLWGRDAEIAAEFLAKGREVSVEGRLQLDVWDDKQSGQKRSRLRVICEQLNLLSNGNGGGNAAPKAPSNGAGQRTAPAAARPPQVQPQEEEGDPIIPF